MALFHIRGINPMGRIVEIVIAAETTTDAKHKAEEAGLKFVVVKDTPTENDPQPPPAPISN